MAGRSVVQGRGFGAWASGDTVNGNRPDKDTGAGRRDAAARRSPVARRSPGAQRSPVTQRTPVTQREPILKRFGAQSVKMVGSMIIGFLIVLLTLLLAGCVTDATTHGQAIDPSRPLTLAGQGSHFVGGRDVESGSLSLLPAYQAQGTITVDQMYVRHQIPAAISGAPVVMIHGCCLTGKTWETTPDGRMGWDEYFLRRGHPVYVVDQAWRGRSAANIESINAVRSGRAAIDQLPTVFAAGHEPAWAIFRFGPDYPKVFPGLKFPLEAQAEFWRQMVPDWLNALPKPNPTIGALSRLNKDLKGAVLMSHSQSGIFPFQVAELNARPGADGGAAAPGKIEAIISIEPGACPAADGDLRPFLKTPILVLFGDYVDLSPRWAPRLSACRAFVEATRQAGGRADLLVLPDVGIRGNSHMLMHDSNSLELADLLVGWIAKQRIASMQQP